MANLPTVFAGFLNLGAPELIIIFAILLLLFGGAKLPGLAKGLGQSIREFKKAAKEEDEPKSAEPKKVSEPGKASGSN